MTDLQFLQQVLNQTNGGFWNSLGALGANDIGFSGGLGETILNKYWADVQPDEDGWYYWIDKYPPSDKLIMYRHEDWDTHLVGYAKDLHPAANIVGMKWKLTGIAKESD